MRLDLSRTRELGEVVSGAFELFAAHAAVFYVATLIVVAPAVLVFDGVLGRQLADGPDATPPVGAALASALVVAFVVPALVTALHVLAVLGLSEGREPTVPGVLRAAAAAGPRALAASVLYALAVGVGFVLLVIPGIYVAIRGYFAAQAAVVDRRSAGDALRRSWDLVEDQWWRTFTVLLVLGLATTVVALIITQVLGAVSTPLVYVVARIVVESATLSIAALGGSLLFFDLRVRKGVVR